MPRYFDKQPLRTGFRHLLGRAALIGLVLILIGVAGVHAKSPVVSEDQVKAVYLFNLTGFVSWPQGAFASSETPLRIAVAGDDRVVAFIETIVLAIEGETAGKRTIVVERLPFSADPAGFHILFITASPDSEISRLLQSVKGLPVLTVGETDGFCGQGGMINLLRRGNRIRLEVNVAAAKASSLQVSSKLLRIATIVEANNGDGGDQ